ncbi:MAG: DNA-processing protein DprA [Candidatus Eisenbacteria bacterium]|nr:DNA-processing protein DprA [Candidatus Eisenbacteria bacterium]
MRLESTEACRVRLKLALARGVPRARLTALLKAAGSPEKMFSPDCEGLALNLSTESTPFFPPEHIEEVDGQLDLARKVRVDIVALTDPEYPSLLKEIQSPPIVIFSRGTLSVVSLPAVAVVGSRRCSHSGLHAAEKLGRGLASAGFVVVSGMARGIDSAAHRGALAAGGTTVAVLGSGVDVCYPRENRRLLEEIEERGAVLSEFPMGTPPLRQNFPLRNRIISGLSSGVVVVEASEESGALVTAIHALEQNRELFAVPGDTTLSSTAGSNRLLKEGARLVTCARDVVEELAPSVAAELEPVRRVSAPLEPLSQDEEDVLECLSHVPVHVDELCEQLGREAPALLPVLLSLELRGLVRQEPGNRYVRSVET